VARNDCKGSRLSLHLQRREFHGLGVRNQHARALQYAGSVPALCQYQAEHKPAVLPVPVCAAAIHIFTANTAGIAF